MKDQTITFAAICQDGTPCSTSFSSWEHGTLNKKMIV